jgi:hypothetical protein
LSASFAGCSGFLDLQPDNIMTEDQVFGDPNLVRSTLSNLYGRVTVGTDVGGDIYDFSYIDEAARESRDAIGAMDRNRWRENYYGFTRNVNQFLKGLRETTELSDAEKAPLMAEARFLRAWTYFHMVRTLGGMPVVGDEVFDYTPGMDIETLQIARSSEAELYDYIISECREIAEALPTGKNVNSARANRWTAKMLEARAAIYAASLAKYNVNHPNLNLPGGVLGIEPDKAAGYYQTAMAAAEDVIKNSPYSLAPTATDKARNFYEAVSVKPNNNEVIWARDYLVPLAMHFFTKNCIPTSIAGENTSCYLSPLLNLVEEFEPIDTATPGQGEKFNVGTLAAPVFFDTPTELFEARDPRLGGTVIYPGAVFRGTEIVLQAGHLVKNGSGAWETKLFPFAEMGQKDENGILKGSINGPFLGDQRLFSKSGFLVRKYLDEKAEAATYIGSDVWNVYFRLAEAYLIAAEALVETGEPAEALPYINAVRSRAGVKPLSTVTFDNIVHERRVEFAFEDHRYWDMRRWRLAHTVWNRDAATAVRRALIPYRVFAPGDPNDGKWFFQEQAMTYLYTNNLHFEDKNYYCEIEQGMINKNPKLIKNPYQ